MQRNYSKNNYEKRDYETYSKRPSKGLIMIKSTVFALSIVLVVLLVAFVLVKNKRGKTMQDVTTECSQVKTILIDKKIQKMEIQNGIITLLTKVDKGSNTQQIIRVESACGNEINRINFKIRNSIEDNSKIKNDD